jgi:mono/diheme cytochrome c family protein
VEVWALEALEEESMRALKLIALAATLLTSAWAIAQQAAQTPPTVNRVPITNTPSNSGKAMFNSYCAVCHGTDGKGNGPAAPAMKTPPADLSGLAQKNGGKYPANHVAAVIRGQAGTPAHGNQEMPVWGPLFSSIDQGNEAKVQQRITNLVTYIGTLQAK